MLKNELERVYDHGVPERLIESNKQTNDLISCNTEDSTEGDIPAIY